MIGPLIQLLWILLYIGVGVAIVYVVLWFLGTILQLPLPQRAIQIVWGCFALLVIIWLLMWLSGSGIDMPKVPG
jgi:hypothetical protein